MDRALSTSLGQRKTKVLGNDCSVETWAKYKEEAFSLSIGRLDSSYFIVFVLHDSACQHLTAPACCDQPRQILGYRYRSCDLFGPLPNT